MNRLDYYRLRNLPENKDLTESEFQMKYMKKRDGGVNFKQTNKIENIEEFKKKMSDMKSNIERKYVQW
jgi:hypothetical protein